MEKSLDILIFFVFTAPVLYFDIKYMRIPLVISIPAIIAGTLFNLFFYQQPGIAALDLCTGFLVFYLIRKLSKNGLGSGDALFSAFIAVLFGIQFWVYAILVSAFIALFFSLTILRLKPDDRKRRIPFVPFLFGGTITVKFISFMLFPKLTDALSMLDVTNFL